jgi:hypothetical protein
MLTPFEPSAGPTGGAGLACPPFTCNFTKPEISLAIFLDLIGDSVPIFIGTPKFNHSRKRTFGAAKVGILSLFSNYFGL